MLQHSEINKGSLSPLKRLATITYSWPPMLRKLDQKVKNFLFTLVLCHKGGVINMVVAIADAKLTQKRNEEHLKLIKLEKSSWTKNLFQWIEFTKRAATTGRHKILVGAQREAGLVFPDEIASKIKNIKYQTHWFWISTKLLPTWHQLQDKP